MHDKAQDLGRIKGSGNENTGPYRAEFRIFYGRSDPRLRRVAMATHALENKLKKKINNLLHLFPPTKRKKKVLLSLQGERGKRKKVARFKGNSGKNFVCSLFSTKCGICPCLRAFILTGKKQTLLKGTCVMRTSALHAWPNCPRILKVELCRCCNWEVISFVIKLSDLCWKHI